ncbi:pseudouridine synthase [Pleomorphomonas sp. NRK KF1]|uniref:pseudouridine synthase n=1 Tax=Pleomorphomonas sp. NRK KF1 TaxID=2943000 RepID=UPI0020444A6F|nr:pseudouridine synthase [Pleomorphomonas sp. NRK KF1]MCM5553059.1 rRNA pseudouridine synthase [Pleomorphomonas sp. NRK KF1]
MIKTPSPAPKAKKSPAKADDGADRIAKVIARAGLCSRREAETWIADGRVKLNGRVLDTPAITVKPDDKVEVDGQPLPERERTRLWLFHKPRGTVTTTYDPEGRPTVFSILPEDLPRVMTIGRLDINTEGLLLLTNDGGLARVLELPATGWLRRYRVRAHGDIDQARLDALKDGIAIDGILYGSVEATIDRRQGDNVWLTVGLREGKNREVKTILAHLGLDVNRLIRVSFGPFQLGELADGAVEEVPRRVLRAQLGDRLAGEAGADFDPREEDRAPIQSVLAKAGKTTPASKDKQPVARDRAQSRPKGVSAAANRKRHEADLDAAQGRQSTGRNSSKTGTGKPPVRVAKAERPQRATLTLKSEAKDGRRDGRLSRRAEAEDAPRAYKSGKSFEVDRKPRAHGDEPARVRGDRPQRGITPKGSRIQDGSPMSAPGGKGSKGGRGGPGKPRGRDADRRR